MKAMVMRPQALLYVPQGQNARPYTDALEKLVRVRLLCAADMNATLSSLAAGNSGSDTGKGPEEAFLVLCGCNSAGLNKILQALRAPGVPPLPLKATLTPTNGSWTVRTLYEEIRREHEAMQGR